MKGKMKSVVNKRSILGSIMLVVICISLVACGGKDSNGYELDKKEPHYEEAIKAMRDLASFHKDSFKILEIYYVPYNQDEMSEHDFIVSKIEYNNEYGNKEVEYSYRFLDSNVSNSEDVDEETEAKFKELVANGKKLDADFIRNTLTS